MTNDISVPGKLFEYMATGKQILAITAKGSEVDQILRETGTGLAAPPDDPEAIDKMLIRAFEAWQRRLPAVQGNRESVRRYERPRLALEYGELMRSAREKCGHAAVCAGVDA